MYVKDVARAFVDAVGKPGTVGRTYCLCGSEVMTWPQMHHAAAEAFVGRRRAVLPLPAWWAKLLSRVVPRPLLPFNRDQVVMSQEDGACQPAESARFAADFGWQPVGYRVALRDYAGGATTAAPPG